MQLFSRTIIYDGLSDSVYLDLGNVLIQFDGLTVSQIWINTWLLECDFLPVRFVPKCGIYRYQVLNFLPSNLSSCNFPRMYAIYGNIYHQYTPFMLASIYHTTGSSEIPMPKIPTIQLCPHNPTMETPIYR